MIGMRDDCTENTNTNVRTFHNIEREIIYGIRYKFDQNVANPLGNDVKIHWAIAELEPTTIQKRNEQPLNQKDRKGILNGI